MSKYFFCFFLTFFWITPFSIAQDVHPGPEAESYDFLKDYSICSPDSIPTEERFDLREQGAVSPIRDQNPHGACWTFGAMASSESTLLKAGNTGQDFSEKFLAYYAYTDMTGPFVAFDRNHPEGSIYDEGGQPEISIPFLSRWGYVSESEVPYQDFDTPPPASATIVRRLSNAYVLPKGTNQKNNFKYALKNFGAFDTSMIFADPRTNYFNPTTAAYYLPTTTDSDHEVTIVGWDDNFSKDNFITKPTNDGAWIVKNSRGTSFGDNGFFYISYEDGSLATENGWVFITESLDTYPTIYQYDMLGASATACIGDDCTSQWFANVFTASASQTLGAVAFYNTGVGSTYEISIYHNVTTSPTSGQQVGSTQSGSLPLPGFITIPLTTPAAVTKGTKFSVVVRLNTTGIAYPIFLEKPVASYNSKATASAGQSYFSGNGVSWLDVALQPQYPNTNVCLKAYATARSTSIAPSYLLLLQ